MNRLFWGVVWFGVWSIGAVMLGTKIGYDVVRPEFQSILTLAGAGMAALLVWPCWYFSVRLGELVAPTVSGVRVVRWFWSRRVIVLGAAALVAVPVATLFFVKFHEPIRLSPWQTPVFLGGAVLVATLLSWGMNYTLRSRLGSRIVAGVLMVLIVASAVGAATLETGDRKARLYFQRTKATRMAYQLATMVMDRDGDGFMHQFAGGDCDPDDEQIGPSALDIPGNGIDEDCDGRDVPLESLERGRFDYPLPETYAYDRPNVVIVSIDALAAEHLGYMGYQRNTSPNLDELAEECVVFEKAFSQGPSTRLSMAAMFTSMYDSQILKGSSANIPYPLLPENETMAELFLKNGYDTVAVIPHDYFTVRWKGILQGFDNIDSSAVTKKGKDKHNAEKVTKAAIAEINKDRSNPLFMWVHYWDVHPPFFLPKRAKAFGKKEKVDIYDSEIRWLDERLEPLFKEIDGGLRKRGYILIVTADHGSAFDERHKKHTHGHDLYTGVLHVPLMVCVSSGVEPRRVTDTPVTLLDVLPTLANMTGLETEGKEFEGTSLVPLIFGDEEWPDRYLFHQFFLLERRREGKDPLVKVGVRTNTMNYIWHREEDRFELFDYVDDPGELLNIMDSEPAMGIGLNAVMHNWLHRVHVAYNSMINKGVIDSDDSGEQGGASDDFSDDY